MNMSQGEALAVDPGRTTGSPQRQEITFADGTAIWLHRVVDAHDLDCTYQRRIELGDGDERVVDLRQLAPSLAYQLPAASTREAAGAVFHGLRKRFSCVAQLRRLLPEEALQ